MPHHEPSKPPPLRENPLDDQIIQASARVARLYHEGVSPSTHNGQRSSNEDADEESGSYLEGVQQGVTGTAVRKPSGTQEEVL